MRCAICSLVLAVVVAGCKGPMQQNLPPASRLMHPGPGVDGPGPGVMMYQQAATMPPQSSQVAFVGPEGTMVAWDRAEHGAFDSEPLICPGRYNFPQGGIYRLKLTNIPGRPGVELYPTLEVGPSMPRTQAFLAHNSLPVQFTEEDFDQVLSGNFVTKVIYLPDAEFQELALAGVETLVSTRLDPGMDPIVEADRQGAILGIVRLGNKDLGIPSNGFMPGMQPPYTAMSRPRAAPPYVAGATAPQWGMSMSGTPIGLPGPPHIPMGGPAGLRKHVIRNHTPMNLPQPTAKVSMDVLQQPSFGYPKPANHAWIIEGTHSRPGAFRSPRESGHSVSAYSTECETGCP